MLKRQPQKDYQSVTRSRPQRVSETGNVFRENWAAGPEDTRSNSRQERDRKESASLRWNVFDQNGSTATLLKRGHAFSYAALFVLFMRGQPNSTHRR